MAYLRYYQHRGDPGFFGGLFSGIKGAVGGAFHAATGLGGGAPKVMPGGAPAGDVAAAIRAALGKGAKAVGKHKGAAIAVGAGAAALGLGAHMMGGHRRYRRMNVCNVRALRRSMRRVKGFAKEARKVMTFTHSHKLKKKRS